MKPYLVGSKRRLIPATEGRNFHGSVLLEDLPDAPASPHLRCAFVRFERGARTKLHYHTGGQVLWVTEGEGFVEFSDGVTHELSADTRVVIPPGELHRHGAKAGADCEHLATTAGETVWWSADPEK